MTARSAFEQGARFGYLGTAFSALRKAGAGPGRTLLIDGISGTLGLGARLIALGLRVTTLDLVGQSPGGPDGLDRVTRAGTQG
ncbi:MAG TPA: hypothetical protein VNT27_11430 [Propionibacteriaceae bacterium]|nr:hypothetical protein [Propionibacteriaceae bacterium]